MPGIWNFIPIVGGLNEFNPINPLMWQEEVGDKGRREDTVTSGESLCTLRGYVLDHSLLQSAIAYWLGYSYVDYNSGSPSYLKVKRVLPACHPEYTQLFANRVRVQGWKYRRKINIPPPNPAGPGLVVPFAEYQKYCLEVDFGMVDYLVLPDGFGGPDTTITEWERFTKIDPEDDTEILTVDGGNYIYKDVAGGTKVPFTTINGPMMRKVVERTELVITVKQLPYDLIFDTFNVPRRLMKAKGRVNYDIFLGFNPQTILLKSWKPVKYPQAVLTQTWTILQFGIDMEFRFSYQEPTKAVWNETLAGWNLAPKAGTRWEDGWHGVILEAPGQPGHGQPVYSSVPMMTLLNHWNGLPAY